MKLKEGDKIPSSAIFYLDEDKKVVKVNLNSIIKKQKVIIFGLPGAFTSICSAIHLPSFLKNFDKAKKKRNFKNYLYFCQRSFCYERMGELS